MTTYELARRLVDNKHETYNVPRLPPANPDDFIVWGDGEFERVMGMVERENPATQFERARDVLEGMKGGTDNSLSGSLTDAGFGSFGPM